MPRRIKIKAVARLKKIIQRGETTFIFKVETAIAKREILSKSPRDHMQIQ